MDAHQYGAKAPRPRSATSDETLAGGTAQGLGKFQNNYADYFRKNSDDLKAPAALTGDDWPTIGDVRGLLERIRGAR